MTKPLTLLPLEDCEHKKGGLGCLCPFVQSSMRSVTTSYGLCIVTTSTRLSCLFRVSSFDQPHLIKKLLQNKAGYENDYVSNDLTANNSDCPTNSL